MYREKRVGVIIPAAGSGTRIGGPVSKQFLTLAGKPIWMLAVEVFESSTIVDHVVLVVPSALVDDVRRESSIGRFKKVAGVVAGGERRQDSVWNGLQALRPHGPEIVLIHDAARPFVGLDVVERVTDAAALFGAAVPAVTPVDTIKIANGESFVESTPERDLLWQVQTPQGFQASVLIDAYERATKDGFYGTDDASLVERTGVRVKIVPGSSENVKITNPEDLAFAEYFVASRGRNVRG